MEPTTLGKAYRLLKRMEIKPIIKPRKNVDRGPHKRRTPAIMFKMFGEGVGDQLRWVEPSRSM